MSYDEKTGKIDWKGEWSWLAVSLISGVNSYFQKRVKRNKISDRSPLKAIF